METNLIYVILAQRVNSHLDIFIESNAIYLFYLSYDFLCSSNVSGLAGKKHLANVKFSFMS